MSQIRKRDVRRAVNRTSELLERNRDGSETLEAVLGPHDVRALNMLIRLGERFLLTPLRTATSARRSVVQS